MSAQSSSSTRIHVYFILIVTVLIWGLSWPVCKIGLRYMSPIWFAAYRAGLGALSMFAIVIACKKLVLPSKRDIPILAIMSFVQVTVFMTLITLGLHYVSAGRSAILVYTTPLWVMPIAILFLGETATRLKWLGFILGMIGVVILFSPWEIDWKNNSVLLGNGLLMLAALSWAICMLCARNMKWFHTPFELISWQLLLGSIPIILIAFVTEPHTMIVWNHALVWSLIYAGVFSTAIAYWGTNVVSKELPSITISLTFLVVPVSGLLFSAWILNEVITMTTWIAMLFILGGLFCVALNKK